MQRCQRQENHPRLANEEGAAETEDDFRHTMEETAAKDGIEPGSPEFIRRRHLAREMLNAGATISGAVVTP